MSKHQITAYKSDSSLQNKRETQSHKFTQTSVVLSIPLHLKLSPDKKFNIVLYGVDECAPGMSRSARQESDLSTVAAVLSSLDSSISSQSITDCLRLGKFFCIEYTITYICIEYTITYICIEYASTVCISAYIMLVCIAVLFKKC